MRHLTDNPPTRFPDRPIDEAEFPWWVAKVKPRQEKAFAEDLLRAEVEYYLPLYTKVTRRRDNNKPRKSIVPLFPGYVSFAQRTPEHIYTGGRVVNIISIRHQKRFVHELTQIYQALEAGASLEPLMERYDPGAEVRVRSGPMRGVVGIITRVHNQTRLVLSVEPFGTASLSIDSAMVEPV